MGHPSPTVSATASPSGSLEAKVAAPGQILSRVVVRHPRNTMPVPAMLDLKRIAARYDLAKMTGPEAVRLASELVGAGFEEADALALTLPISSRNVMRKLGKVSRAPRIQNWADLWQHHATALDAAREGADRKRLDQMARMVALAQTLAEA